MDNQLRLFEKPRCFVNGVPKYGIATDDYLSRKEIGWEEQCKLMGIESEKEFRKRMQLQRKEADNG